MKKSELMFNVLLVPIDFLMVILAGILAYYVRFAPQLEVLRPVGFEMDYQAFLEIVFAMVPIFIGFFAFFGLYSLSSVRKFWREILRVVAGVSASFMFILFMIFFAREEFPSRFIFFAAWLLAILTISIGRVIVRFIQGYVARKYSFGFHRLVLVGNNSLMKTIQGEINRNHTLGYKVVRKLKKVDLDLLTKLHNDPGIDEIILCSSEMDKNEVQILLDFCREKNIVFKFVPDMFQSQAALFEMETLSDVTLIEVKRTSLEGWGRIIKRVVDVIFSAIALVVLSPFFLLIAFLIKLDSAGPVYARLDRIGQGKKFKLYKFRSMYRGAHQMKYNPDGTLSEEFKKINERGEGPLFKTRNDPRVTHLGKFIRKTRLDEFPQLINVLKGDMSLVGPRPHEPEEVAKYENRHRKLLTIKPGITGMSQVNGSSDLDFEREVKLDVFYIENWSLGLDIILLFKTFLIFLEGDDSAC
ncbi:MAG: sugar transferase [Candidatus Pacebacteria bacterium]|nr:sugar transferase [Candidatus Paceibacterota bacterium]